MTVKNPAKAYTLAQAKSDIITISKTVVKALVTATERRAEIARKLSLAGHTNTEIVKVFQDAHDEMVASNLEPDFKVAGSAQVGRDIYTSKVQDLMPKLDFTAFSQALRDTKQSGITISQIKEIVDNPQATKADKVKALAPLASEYLKDAEDGKGKGKGKSKNKPRQGWELFTADLDSAIERLKSGKVDVADAVSIFNAKARELKSIVEKIKTAEADN